MSDHAHTDVPAAKAARVRVSAETEAKVERLSARLQLPHREVYERAVELIFSRCHAQPGDDIAALAEGLGRAERALLFLAETNAALFSALATLEHAYWHDVRHWLETPKETSK